MAKIDVYKRRQLFRIFAQPLSVFEMLIFKIFYLENVGQGDGAAWTMLVFDGRISTSVTVTVAIFAIVINVFEILILQIFNLENLVL